ncbi:MAG: hypothetical protein IPM06_21775 [Rhizobiales bacterium]|nr:hypothetical protein [Hyphomicrobiales bacterium]
MTWPTPDLAATRAAVDRNLSRCMELIETDPTRALQAADAAARRHAGSVLSGLAPPPHVRHREGDAMTSDQQQIYDDPKAMPEQT